MRAERRSCWALGLVTLLVIGCGAPLGSTRPAGQRQASAARPPATGEASGWETGSDAHPAPSSGDQDPHAEPLDDSGELTDEGADETQQVRPHPLDGWSDAQLKSAIEQDLASLGSMSLGSANAGALLNGVQAEKSALYEPISPGSAWATRETLEFLNVALSKVHEQFPETPALALGDISTKNGGPARPHISHQSGRDVDIAYFYVDGARWYARGTAKNLDLPRNWAFVRALISDTDVDLILIDRSIQVLLEHYALSQGEDASWLSSVFRGVPGRLRPIVRHAPGHATHIHIRFFNPIAQETARRCHALLLQAKLTHAPRSYLTHRVKKNETLGMIARKYRVSVRSLRAENGLKSSLIREKSVLRVPVASRGPARTAERISVPSRRTPPPRDLAATSDAGLVQPPPTR